MNISGFVTATVDIGEISLIRTYYACPLITMARQAKLQMIMHGLICLMITHKHAYSYLTVIGVHEMHGLMHPNYCQITILLVVDPPFIICLPYDDPPLSCTQQFAYKKKLVARQLPTNRRESDHQRRRRETSDQRQQRLQARQ